MYKNIISLVRISIGLVLLLLGTIGVLLPVLHGWLLIAIAIPLISPEHGKKIFAYIKAWKAKSFTWASRKKTQSKN